jgi:hypothetical protein
LNDEHSDYILQILEIHMSQDDKGQPQQGGHADKQNQQGQQQPGQQQPGQKPGQQSQQQPSEKPGTGAGKN